MLRFTVAVACSFFFCGINHAEDTSAPTKMELSEGRIHLDAPASWTSKEPSVRILDYEFEVSAAEGDEQAGRVTVMGAGGSLKANVDRWVGQFSQPDGGGTRDRGKFEDKEIGGAKVHLVDLTGTFKDQRGPFAPATMREEYRMLAAIIQTENFGQYFVKFYGPKKTVAANEEAFEKMIESLKLDKE
jgi:hypothetical protein